MAQVNNKFDEKATVTKWKTSLGNGKAALAEAHQAIEAVVISRDTTVIGRMIDAARDKQDNAAAQTLSFLTRQVWPKAKITVSKKDDRTSIIIKGIEARNEPVVTLAECVTKGLSLRGATLRKEMTGETTTPDFDATKWADNMVARGHKNGLTLAAMKAALDAAEKRYAAKEAKKD